jgi:hypothetical protein
MRRSAAEVEEREARAIEQEWGAEAARGLALAAA